LVTDVFAFVDMLNSFWGQRSRLHRQRPENGGE